MTKKLTNTKGFPLVMMIMAFLFSAASVVQEFVMLMIYKEIYSKSNDKLVNYVLLNGKDFFDVYGTAVFLFVFTFLVMFVFISGVGKKTTGTKEGAIVMITGIAGAVTPAVKTVQFLLDGGLDKNQYDAQLFRSVNQLVNYALPVFICMLIALSGLGILIKAAASKTSVEVFKNVKTEMPVNVPVQENVTVQPAVEEATVVSENTEAVAASVPVDDRTAVQAEPAQNVCKSCNEVLPDGAKFCRSCGAKQD